MKTRIVSRKKIEWVSVKDRLPELGVWVEVKGLYTPEGHGWPIAYRRKSRPIAYRRKSGIEMQDTRWESNEWRGQTAITHWRPIPAKRLD